MQDYDFREGNWIMVTTQGRKFKGYVFDKGVYKSIINVWVPSANKGRGDYSPHCYHNDQISSLPLESFDNEKDFYIEAGLLLKCEKTFKGAFE